MVKRVDLDPATPLFAQFKEKTGPVVLVNTFVVPRDDMDAFLEIWKEDAALMKSRPGFISTQLHRGTAGSLLLVNIATWESTEAIQAAFSNPEFQQKMAKYPDGIVTHPHIFEKVAVPGVCVA